MNADRPNVAPQGRYDTKRACAELGISRSTLTRYRQAGYIREGRYKTNMRLYFKGSEIIRLWSMIL